MIKVGSSYIRKFQFFEVVSGIKPPIDEHISSSPSNSEDESIENKEKEKPENTEEDSSININDITISDPRQMKIYNDIIFISGKAKHKKSGQMIRENLIMKIKDNVVLDEATIPKKKTPSQPIKKQFLWLSCRTQSLTIISRTFEK